MPPNVNDNIQKIWEEQIKLDDDPTNSILNKTFSTAPFQRTFSGVDTKSEFLNLVRDGESLRYQKYLRSNSINANPTRRLDDKTLKLAGRS
jgi:hypothetical protein